MCEQSSEDSKIVGLAVDDDTDVDTLFRSPEDFVRVASQVLQTATPEKIEEASRLISSNSSGVRRISQQLQSQMTPQQLQGLQRIIGVNAEAVPQDLARAMKGEARRAVLIKASRTSKEILLHDGNLRSELAAHLGGEPVEYGCGRMSQGPLAGLVVKVYFNPKTPTQKNRRASRLAGFPVRGAAVFRCEGSDITEDILESVEAVVTSAR